MDEVSKSAHKNGSVDIDRHVTTGLKASEQLPNELWCYSIMGQDLCG